MSARNGRLAIVGLGPGDPAYLCERARPALAAVEVVIAYAPYCDRVAALLPGIPVEPWPIGAEAERAADAAARARAGASVAVVSSGDPGVYGMAGLCLEALYELGWDGRDDPEVEIGWGRRSPSTSPASASPTCSSPGSSSSAGSRRSAPATSPSPSTTPGAGPGPTPSTGL